MDDSVLNQPSLPAQGEFVPVDGGVQAWRAAFTSVQVSSPAGGGKVLVIESTGGAVQRIELSASAAVHLAELLIT